jgi:hypothetical protein
MSTGKIKRSPNTYQKINTIFMRDAKNVIMPYDGFTEPEFEYLRGLKWRAEIKIDGTNIRIEVSKEPIWNGGNPDTVIGVRFNVEYKGKTDNAQISPKMLKFMQDNFPEDKVLTALGLKKEILESEWVDHKWTYDDGETPNYEAIPNLYTIYGEGYGLGIQKGGNYIKDGVDFRVFDAKVSCKYHKGNMQVDDIYLNTEARDEIANKLGANIVPFYGYLTIDEAVEVVRKGIVTGMWANPNLVEEGLVLRTDCGLLNRQGKRLIVKIKTEDFVKYRNVYGTDGPVEQPENKYY